MQNDAIVERRNPVPAVQPTLAVTWGKGTFVPPGKFPLLLMHTVYCYARMYVQLFFFCIVGFTNHCLLVCALLGPKVSCVLVGATRLFGVLSGA